jgi:hypothetical protein
MLAYAGEVQRLQHQLLEELHELKARGIQVLNPKP